MRNHSCQVKRLVNLIFDDITAERAKWDRSPFQPINAQQIEAVIAVLGRRLRKANPVTAMSICMAIVDRAGRRAGKHNQRKAENR